MGLTPMELQAQERAWAPARVQARAPERVRERVQARAPDQVRERVHSLGIRAIEAALEERKKRGIAGPA